MSGRTCILKEEDDEMLQLAPRDYEHKEKQKNERVEIILIDEEKDKVSIDVINEKQFIMWTNLRQLLLLRTSTLGDVLKYCKTVILSTGSLKYFAFESNEEINIENWICFYRHNPLVHYQPI